MNVRLYDTLIRKCKFYRVVDEDDEHFVIKQLEGLQDP